MAAREWLHGLRDLGLANFRYDPALPDRSLEEVLAAARGEWEDAGDEWWPNVCALAERGTVEVLDAMRALAADADADARALAAYVLGQLGDGAFPDEQAAALAALAERREQPRRAGLDRLRLRAPGRAVRRGLAARARRRRGPGPPRGGRVRALRPRRPALDRRADRALGRPGDRRARLGHVRLGSLADQDTEALRDALAARLDDPDEGTRLEAVHGLVMRGDPRALAPARELLAQADGADSVWTRHLLLETREQLGG